MHASIATPGLAANLHPGNRRDHLRIVERPDAQCVNADSILFLI